VNTQEKQKKEAAANNGLNKAVKQSAGELRLQKGSRLCCNFAR